NKAGFLLIQSYVEQSPVVTTKPSMNGNRMFNVQAKVVRDPRTKKILGVVPGQEEPGVTIVQLWQGGGPTGAPPVKKNSPTFHYVKPTRAVTQYFKVLRERYGHPYSILTSSDGSFGAFAAALESSKFAEEENYASKMTDRIDQVHIQANRWIDYRLQTLQQ